MRARERPRIDPLWAKAPGVLLRYPGLFASLAVGALLLALVGASYPLFISSASSVALRKQIDEVNRFAAGMTLDRALTLDDPRDGDALTFEERTRTFARVIAREHGFADPVAAMISAVLDRRSGQFGTNAYDITSIERPRGRETSNVLLARTGALDHVSVVEGREGDGVWISDLTAETLNLDPEDRINVTQPFSRRSVEVEVDGIYRALVNEPRTPYWSSFSREIYPENPDAQPPPPFMFTDFDHMTEISRALNQPFASFRWEAPLALREDISLSDAQRIHSFIERIDRAIRNPGSDLREAFGCVRCFSEDLQVETDMPTVLSETRERLAPVRGPVQLLLAAGLLVALAIVAASGAFVVATRRIESTLLFARGMNPWALGLKAVLETILPVVVGSGAGLALAMALVAAFGPGGPVDPAAVGSAWRNAALLAPAGLAMVGLVTGLSFVRQSEAGSARLGALARIPWPVVFLVASLFFLNRLVVLGSLVDAGTEDVARPSVHLLLFPVFFIAGSAGIAAHVVQEGFRRARPTSARFGSALYLFVHRLAGAPRLTIGLLSACALALGVFVFAQTMTSSLQTTITAKSLLFIGGDVQGTSRPDQRLPADFPYPSTSVTRFSAGGQIGDETVDVLAVDPVTLPSVAYWDASFGADSIADLMGRLRDADRDRVPVIVTDPALGNAGDLLTIGSTAVPIDVVARVTAFPGVSTEHPLVVADADTLTETFQAAGAAVDPLEDAGAASELWIKGPTQGILAALARVEDPPYFVVTAAEVRDIPSMSAVIDTYGVLQTLGLGAALLVVVVLLMYLQARQRGRVVSFALSRRMGLSTSSHRFALILELATMFIASYVVALALGLIAARIIVGNVDPLPEITPGPLFRPPIVPFVLAFLGLVLVSIAGGYVSNRRAERTHVAEVMRLAA